MTEMSFFARQAKRIETLALARDARDVAKRAHESVVQIFRFAIARERATDPAAEFKPRDILAQARTENFARVDAKDLPEFLVKMDGYNGDAIMPIWPPS
ncbi:MAG TPA: hypothetical protein VGE93_13010 [Bryobacteraceae bacterium]|nr:hypothetical protein [Acidobacteriaceae bacterium]